MPSLTSDPHLAKLFEFNVRSDAVTSFMVPKASNSNVAVETVSFKTANSPPITRWTSYTEALKPFLSTEGAQHYEKAPKAMSDPNPTREEIQAQIAASEARGETKLARLEGKLDLVLVKLDDVREDGRHTRNNAILIGVSLALLIIGIVATAPVIFDLGSKFRETITKEVQDRIPQSAAPKPQK
jgi:hypothetical protein